MLTEIKSAALFLDKNVGLRDTKKELRSMGI